MTERHCWSHLSRALRRVLLAVACVTTSASGGGGSVLPGLTDALVHAPPASGPFAYNSFVPALTQGTSYVDPVFGTTVRRLTTDHSQDNIYARNMWWSADGKRYLHRVCCSTDYWKVIEAVTGKVTHTNVPDGAASDLAGDGGFDPVDPTVLYYLSGTQIHKVTLQAGGTWTDSVYFTAPAPLMGLGGTLNWLDASGRYMLVRYGAEPSVYLFDRQNLAAGPYANPVNGANTIDMNSYVGITPDGQFLVGFQKGLGLQGYAGVSWKIDHANRSVASTPMEFWSLCGDHGSFLSASDGRNYMITFDCYDAPELWRVDITNNAHGLTYAQQKALPSNKRLLTLRWNDSGHITTVARGILQDWALLSNEDATDAFNGPVSPWHAYRQEIIAFNVITGETRRLAHHRSRSQGANYYYTNRVSVSWAGENVAFASNFNQNGVVDIYAIPFSVPSQSLISPRTTSRPQRHS